MLPKSSKMSSSTRWSDVPCQHFKCSCLTSTVYTK